MSQWGTLGRNLSLAPVCWLRDTSGMTRFPCILDREPLLENQAHHVAHGPFVLRGNPEEAGFERWPDAHSRQFASQLFALGAHRLRRKAPDRSPGEGQPSRQGEVDRLAGSGSTGGTCTTDLLVMSQASCSCSTVRHVLTPPFLVGSVGVKRTISRGAVRDVLPREPDAAKAKRLQSGRFGDLRALKEPLVELRHFVVGRSHAAVRSSRGYKSGRSSCRGTPLASSSASTRSAGTPFRRHLSTA